MQVDGVLFYPFDSYSLFYFFFTLCSLYFVRIRIYMCVMCMCFIYEMQLKLVCMTTDAPIVLHCAWYCFVVARTRFALFIYERSKWEGKKIVESSENVLYLFGIGSQFPNVLSIYCFALKITNLRIPSVRTKKNFLSSCVYFLRQYLHYIYPTWLVPDIRKAIRHNYSWFRSTYDRNSIFFAFLIKWLLEL